ncbi:MAG: 23S rRNA (adenine(2503)-C(2))-methyltransferase RlmN, partial [Lachnospiraceae bacterium]|nr:23S rRNA (adenine(2503)-C(2))-methyltransferase RlmN [Lachnospiraceae bacterium]MBO4559862.1 23S rRNA (adenine(2503)-C(2))-methyltransferase RlmN [Lachnospiraceae bacterium]
MEDIKSLSIEELQTYLEGIGEKKFRAAQVYEWLHKKLVTEWDAMTNISAALRKKLAEDFYLPKLEIATVLKSESDG